MLYHPQYPIETSKQATQINQLTHFQRGRERDPLFLISTAEHQCIIQWVMWLKSPSENYLPWWPWSTTRKLTLQTEINCFNYLLSQWVNPAYRKSIPGWQWWMATLTSRELPDLLHRVEQDWDFWWIFFFYLSCWDMLSPSKISAQVRGCPVETSIHHCVQHPPYLPPSSAPT